MPNWTKLNLENHERRDYEKRFRGLETLPHLDSFEQPEKSEKDLHELIIEECKRRRWLCFHGAMHKRAWRNLGEPDFQIYADRGRHFLIECKTSKGKLTPEQIGVAMMAETLGHKVFCVRSFQQFLETTK